MLGRERGGLATAPLEWVGNLDSGYGWPTTFTGVALSASVPVPSLPSSLNPSSTPAPSVARPQALASPTLSAVNVCSPGTGNGVG